MINNYQNKKINIKIKILLLIKMKINTLETLRNDLEALRNWENVKNIKGRDEKLNYLDDLINRGESISKILDDKQLQLELSKQIK
jgi:hypothetical protein